MVHLPNPPPSPRRRRQGPHRDVLPRLLEVAPHPEPLAVQVRAQPRARRVPVPRALPRLLAERHVRREDVFRARRPAVLARRTAVAAFPRCRLLLVLREVGIVHERVDPAPVELDAGLGMTGAVEVRAYALDLHPPEEVAVLAPPAPSLAEVALEDDVDVLLERGLGRAEDEEAALDSHVLLAAGVDLPKANGGRKRVEYTAAQ